MVLSVSLVGLSVLALLAGQIVGFFVIDGMFVFARIFVIDGMFVFARIFVIDGMFVFARNQTIAREFVLLMAFNDALTDAIENASSWAACDFQWSRNCGLGRHDAAGSLCQGTGVKASERVDVPSSISESVIASDSVFAFELLDLSESREIKASQASEKVKPEPLESQSFQIGVKKRISVGSFGLVGQRFGVQCFQCLMTIILHVVAA